MRSLPEPELVDVFSPLLNPTPEVGTSNYQDKNMRLQVPIHLGQ